MRRWWTRLRAVGWLERYWLLYILVYPAGLLGLGLALRPAWNAVEVWSAIVTLSFGMAAGVALALEAALMVTLPALEKIRKLKAEGRAEGRAEGLAEGLAEGSREERRRWLAWKEAAERAGVVFPEPPPDEHDHLEP